MSSAAPGAGGNDDGAVPRRVSRAELVRRWEHVFDNAGDEEAMELFTTLLLRDARAEHARQARTEEQEREEEERRARVFKAWHPPQPGSAPPPLQAPPRVDRSVVLGLRAPPHLLPPRPKQERPPVPKPADLGRPANNTRGGV